MSGQKAVQLVGKSLAVFPAERRGTTRNHAVVSQLIHKVTHGQQVLDVVFRIEFTPGIDRKASLGNYPVCERNIGSNH